MPDGSSAILLRDAWARFTGLPRNHAAVNTLAEASHVRRLPARSVLVEESDDDTDVFLVETGRLRTIRLLGDGQEVWLADAGPGELVGELSALTGQRRTSSVVAASAVQVYAIERSAFLSAAQRHGEVSFALAKLLAARLVRTSGHMADLFGKTVAYRLHRELIRLGTASPIAGELVRLSAPPTVTDLKQRVHASREATSRAMSDLEERGLVIRTEGVWIVRDLPEN